MLYQPPPQQLNQSAWMHQGVTKTWNRLGPEQHHSGHSLMKLEIESSPHQPSFCNSRMQEQLLKKQKIMLINCKSSCDVGA